MEVRSEQGEAANLGSNVTRFNKYNVTLLDFPRVVGCTFIVKSCFNDSNKFNSNINSVLIRLYDHITVEAVLIRLSTIQ